MGVPFPRHALRCEFRESQEEARVEVQAPAEGRSHLLLLPVPEAWPRQGLVRPRVGRGGHQGRLLASLSELLRLPASQRSSGRPQLPIASASLTASALLLRQAIPWRPLLLLFSAAIFPVAATPAKRQ